MSYKTNILNRLKQENFSVSDVQASSTPFQCFFLPKTITQGCHKPGNNLTWNWGRKCFRRPNAASTPTASQAWDISAAESPQVSTFPAGLPPETVLGTKATETAQTSLHQPSWKAHSFSVLRLINAMSCPSPSHSCPFPSPHSLCIREISALQKASSCWNNYNCAEPIPLLKSLASIK